MRFGLMSQLQVPKPWGPDTERTVYWQNLDHVVAAEAAGFSYFWLTEQHFFAEIGGTSAAPPRASTTATTTPS
jgi:alkanesulfonate monooxygenase SsuD/methylene tetrahydromethanopterin reductase-like flavin-dependent oxidoreductase (luciferase family)